jgi:hypothetical protein
MHNLNWILQLTIGSELYVAKKFFEIGSGEVTAGENAAHLENELIRLKIAEWFLSKFKSQAKEHGVEFASSTLISFFEFSVSLIYALRHHHIRGLSCSRNW